MAPSDGRRLVSQSTWALLTLAVLLAFRAGEIPLLLLTTNQSYGSSLGLFGIAIYLSRRATLISRVAAVTVMILAAWTNAGVALFVGTVALTLVCFRTTRDGRDRSASRDDRFDPCPRRSAGFGVRLLSWIAPG